MEHTIKLHHVMKLSWRIQFRKKCNRSKALESSIKIHQQVKSATPAPEQQQEASTDLPF
ncbi:MAG: hypothetical protein JST86_09490 [Bacteroidetes bacterium]|nr:hypothetical protein [Bacteroidota bacterium]